MTSIHGCWSTTASPPPSTRWPTGFRRFKSCHPDHAQFRPSSVSNADALVAAVRNDPPDVVVTDVRMPPTFSDEGLRAAAEIRAGNRRPSPRTSG